MKARQELREPGLPHPVGQEHRVAATDEQNVGLLDADVASFYRALLGGRLVTPRLFKAMTTTIPERGKTDVPS